MLVSESQRRLMVAGLANVALCVAIGALVAGLRGAQAGLVAGIALAAIPLAATAFARRLARPQSLLRRFALETASLAVAVSGAFAGAVGRGLEALFAPVIDLLRWPWLGLRLVQLMVFDAAGAALAAAGRAFATPLGMANIVALLIVALEIAHVDIATWAMFPALGAMILVLLATAQEEADGLGGGAS